MDVNVFIASLAFFTTFHSAFKITLLLECKLGSFQKSGPLLKETKKENGGMKQNNLVMFLLSNSFEFNHLKT